MFTRVLTLVSDIYPACYLSQFIVPLWSPNSGRRQRDVWRPLTGEPDGSNPSLKQSQKSVGVPGQCGANLDNAFQMVRLASLDLGPVGAPGRSPKVDPQRAQGNCPVGGTRLRMTVAGSELEEGPLLCVKHLDIIFRLLKTLTILG